MSTGSRCLNLSCSARGSGCGSQNTSIMNKNKNKVMVSEMRVTGE
jgi:hypothetical protein